MTKHRAAMFYFQSDRLHQAMAIRPAITGIDVHMPTPQTTGAMVGVTGTNHQRPAMMTAKRFWFFDEMLDHRMGLATPQLGFQPVNGRHRCGINPAHGGQIPAGISAQG